MIKSIESNLNLLVRITKPVLQRKGTSTFSAPVQVGKVTGSAVLLHNRGWWNKSSVVVLKPGQENMFKEVVGDSSFLDDVGQEKYLKSWWLTIHFRVNDNEKIVLNGEKWVGQ